MPEPYLNVPLDLSEADEEQEAVMYWARDTGLECFKLADEVASRLDQFPDHWKPEHLPVLERVCQDLRAINTQLKAEGHNV